MLFNLGQTFRSLTTSPASMAIDQAHRMAQRRLLEAGGPAVLARGRVDDGAGKRPARVPITATPRGFRRVTLDLPEAFVDRLIGHLRQADREDKNEVLQALYSALGDVHP